MSQSHSEKISFSTQKEAQAAATVAQANYDSKRLKTYHCSQCSLWHLASDHGDDDEY